MRKLCASTLAVPLLLCAAFVQAGVFQVKPGAPNQVVFTSKATAETFQGKTDKLSGRITLDPSLRAQSTADELASIGCDNVVLVMKTDEGSTKLVHADGVLAGGWGECHYQVTDVPSGGATFSGKVVALSIPDYRYSLISKADFNAVKCGGSLASLNQQLDFVLTVADVRGR